MRALPRNPTFPEPPSRVVWGGRSLSRAPGVRWQGGCRGERRGGVMQVFRGRQLTHRCRRTGSGGLWRPEHALLHRVDARPGPTDGDYAALDLWL